MKKKIKVAVLMGGKSSERKVSLLSGSEVYKNIDRNKYKVVKLIIPQVGNAWVDKLLKCKPDLVFIALHGKFGEDGTVQGMLDILNIKYTGSGALASAIGMNKIIFKKIMKSHGVLVPKDVTKSPCVLKPADGGSSIGVYFASSQDELDKAMKSVRRYSRDIIIEEYIKGREFTCGVIGNSEAVALPVVEIKRTNNIFDYKSKYLESDSHEIVPANVPTGLANKIQELALRVYKIVGCKGFARIDFILTKNNRIVTLEINTIPGLTKMSLLPKEAIALGILYKNLIDKIISYAIKE